MRQREAGVGRHGAQRVHGVVLGVVRRHVLAGVVGPRAGGRRHVAPVLPGEPAAVQRRPHQHAEPVAPGGGQHGGLHAARQDRIRRLLAHERVGVAALRGPLPLHHQLGGPRRGAGVADLALAHQVVERAHQFVHRRVGVGPVHLVQVDPVGLQAAQAGVEGLHDPPARGAALVRPRAHRVPELRAEHHVVAAPPERAAHDLLGLPVGVHVGRVDHVDAGVERVVDDALAVVVIGVAPRPEHHGAEAQAAHPHAGGSQGSLLHRRSSVVSGALSAPGTRWPGACRRRRPRPAAPRAGCARRTCRPARPRAGWPAPSPPPRSTGRDPRTRRTRRRRR